MPLAVIWIVPTFSPCAFLTSASLPVLRVEHEGTPDSSVWVRIAYSNSGKMCGVRARYCILACYNALIPSLMPEIPTHQKEALAYPVKVPMLYSNVLLRKWTAFQKLGVSRISAPAMYHQNTFLDPGSTVGGYQGVTTPEDPIIFHLVANPNKPGLPRKEQNRAGQQELLSMTFDQFELKIRQQLARMLGPGGFGSGRRYHGYYSEPLAVRLRVYVRYAS
jgi:spermidine dehydrogenase